MKNREKNFFNNKWIDSISTQTFKNQSFLNKKEFLYPDSNFKDLDKVIISSQKGLLLNKNLNFKERAKHLFKIYKLIKKNNKLIAKFEMHETGKKYKQAIDEINHSAKIWLYASQVAKSLNFKKKLSSKHTGLIRYEPVGVVTLIIPWNFPFIVTSERLPFILAAGNSVIIKPSEFASQSICYLIKLCKKVGLPSGVINLIHGHGNKIGKKLISKKEINMVSFTGSTKVGKQIMSASSKTIKRLSLELGGKNTIIVRADANIKKSCDIIIKGFTLNAGQCCVATSKLLVHENIKDRLVAHLIDTISKTESFEKEFGPISTLLQFNKIKKLLIKNKKYKNKIIFGSLNFKKNNHIDPIIFLDLPLNNSLITTEIFGPILTINSYKNDEEATNIANDTEYGLSAVVCGYDIKKNNKIANNLNSGRIWINESIAVNYANLPIGGFKQSGFNRECGTEGIKTYSEIKSIIINHA